jgi:hypothetical protein
MPRHLHTESHYIFGLENFKDGRHYLLQRHATCTTMRRIYLVWKISRWSPLPLTTPRHLHNNAQHTFGLENLKMAATMICNARPPAQHWSAYIWFGKFKDGCHYLLQRHASYTTMLNIYLVWKI